MSAAADRTAARLLAEHGQRHPTSRVPLADLAELAVDYQRLARAAAGAETIGVVYVTLAAAETYAAAEQIQIEEARRELTELLLDAARVKGEPSARGATELWRCRRRSTGLDISARISRESKLAVVVSINVREHNVGGGR